MYRACMGRNGVSRKVYSSYGDWGSRQSRCSTGQGCGAGPNLADLAPSPLQHGLLVTPAASSEKVHRCFKGVGERDEKRNGKAERRGWGPGQDRAVALERRG